MMLLLRELMVVVYVRVPSTLNATLCLRSFVGAPLHMHKKKTGCSNKDNNNKEQTEKKKSKRKNMSE